MRRPVAGLPDDLKAETSLGRPISEPEHDEQVDAADPPAERTAVGWVVEFSTYRADEPPVDRRNRIDDFGAAAIVADDPPLPTDVATMSPVDVVVVESSDPRFKIEVTSRVTFDSSAAPVFDTSTFDVEVRDDAVISAEAVS